MPCIAAKERATSIHAGPAKIAALEQGAYRRQGGGRWNPAGRRGAAGARSRQGMDAAGRRFRGETSPMNDRGKTAIHAPEPVSRIMESTGRVERCWANRGKAAFTAGYGTLAAGEEVEDRVGAGFCTLQACLSAGNRSESDGGNRHPYPRASVSVSGHMELPSYIVSQPCWRRQIVEGKHVGGEERAGAF